MNQPPFDAMLAIMEERTTNLELGTDDQVVETVYQARPIKRARRTKAQVEQLEEQIYDVLAEDHPQSVRHVFYRMTDPRLREPVEKSEHGYAQVQSRMTKMRRAGTILYGWITDATRRGV